MANPVLIAKAAATVLTDERARKAAGWVLVAILSPLILLIAFLCSLGSGTSSHNASAVEVCFNGAAIPDSVPAEYRTCLENMRSGLSQVDTAVSMINTQTEDGKSLDTVRVKAIFYALYFGSESQPEAQWFTDCFVTYEERTRMVYLDDLISLLPTPVYEKIIGEICEEEQQREQAIATSQRYAVFRVGENGREEYFRLDQNYELLEAARTLRKYLWQESRADASSFADLFPKRETITPEEFDRMVLARMENTGKVTGVFDLEMEEDVAAPTQQMI